MPIQISAEVRPNLLLVLGRFPICPTLSGAFAQIRARSTVYMPRITFSNHSAQIGLCRVGSSFALGVCHHIR